ncbi:ABC transporter permease [Sphaerobacter sp.]|uniref:ABC transporter permease n=1 Tax=Sphaerobacter sp. TaxID=2099654 RepID=UPI001DA000F1|nr:ABC transporter permease [Sphaerobacter sp.]MBX5445155.1 ABC transporter permease [Sphaerobacter sp.]
MTAGRGDQLTRTRRKQAHNTAWYRALHSPRVVIAGAFLIIVAATAIAAPVLAPHDATEPLTMPLLPPGGDYPLGTDDFGRDVLSRLIYAGRVSLGVSTASVAIATLVGVWLGLFAGYYRGVIETLIMRAMDILLSFPTIVLAIAIVAMLGPNLRNVVIVIAIVYTPRFVRIVYGATLSVREAEFIQAARAIGAEDLRILRTAVLPNVMAPILVQISLSLGFAILVETGLSFLGLGAQPPTPSWGNMVSAARDFMESNPWLLIAPASMVGLTILALNTLGDGLRDVLDPRLRGTG